MVDQKRIAFNPAVELSYLKPEEQKNLLETIDFTQANAHLNILRSMYLPLTP